MNTITETLNSVEVGDTRKRKTTIQYSPEKRKIDHHRRTKKGRSSDSESPPVLCIVDSSDEEASIDERYD